MQPPPLLVFATRNPHKTAEVRAMLGPAFEVKNAADYPDFPHIDETGTTFLENARLKALGISRCIAGWVLSDDSGLEVDALDGAPGVWSSSYGGIEGDHPRNNTRLLREMMGHADRRARFRCTMVLARDGHEQAHFSGTVEGRILESMEGHGGFGYDPLFAPDGHDASFASLPPEVKNQLSHRARALQQVVAYLKNDREDAKHYD